MHAMDSTAYFAGAVTYMHEMVMKLTTGVNIIKHFKFVIYKCP